MIVFIAIEHIGEALPQCVVSLKYLSNAAMKPGRKRQTLPKRQTLTLLKRYLETRSHAVKKDRDLSCFLRLSENVKRQRLDKNGQIYQKGAEIVKASYQVALLVAKNTKAHTIAESLVTPAPKILVRHANVEKAVSKCESFRH